VAVKSPPIVKVVPEVKVITGTPVGVIVKLLKVVVPEITCGVAVTPLKVTVPAPATKPAVPTELVRLPATEIAYTPAANAPWEIVKSPLTTKGAPRVQLPETLLNLIL